MKNFLFLLLLLSANCFCDIPLSKLDFNNPPKTLQNHILDMIDKANDEIARMEYYNYQYDNVSIYQVGYQIGKRSAYHEMLDYIESNQPVSR